MEFLLKWIEALESGRYTQCRGSEKRGDGFCALGVAIHTQNPLYWLILQTDREKCQRIVNNIRAALREIDMTIEMIVAWNDEDRLTFHEIAQRIRRHLIEQRMLIEEESRHEERVLATCP